MDERWDKFISLLAALGLLAFLAVFAVLNFRYGQVFCDGDVYTDMALAREIWRQKTLFPSNWIFGNQYYVVATPVLAALFYGLTGSMNLSMSLATTAMGLLVLLSLAWMLRPFVRRRSHRLLSLLMLCAAAMGTRLLLEPEGQLFFVMASYYACYLITLFLVFGDYVRAMQTPEKARPLALSLTLLLCFATGMHSLRQTAVMVLPLLALELLALLLRLARREPAFPHARRGAMLRCLCYTIANLLGNALIRLMHIPAHSIYGSVASASDSLYERLHNLWAAWRGISGLDAACFGEARLFFALFFLFQLLCVAYAALIVLRRLREGVDALARLWLLSLISLGGTFLTGLLIQIQMREIYLFVWYPLVTLSLLLALERGLPLRRWLALAAVILCLGNLSASYGSTLRYAREEDAALAPQRRFCADALEAGIEYVYGDWLFLPRYLYPSDGALTGGFWDGMPYLIRRSINRQDIYREEDNARALYLISPLLREYNLRCAEEQGAEFELFGEYGECLVFKSARQIMQPRPED